MKGVIFTFALTYGGAAMSIVRPYAGLLIYVCFALLRPQALWSFALPSGGNYSWIVAVALLAGWVLNGCGSWRFGKARGVVFALLGFWAWIAVSAAAAPQQERAWAYFESLSKAFLPCLVAITLVRSVRQLRQLAWVIALSQGYLAYEFNQQYYEGRIIEWEWTFGGLDNNGIAITMVTSVGLAFFLGMHETSPLRKVAAFGSAALMAHVVLFSMSRGGMLALAVTGLVCFLLLPKRPQHYLAFLVAALLVLRLAGPSVTREFSTSFAEEGERDASAESRVDLWIACWDAMLEHPVTGLGPTHWPLVAHEYGFAPGKAAHTTWLLVGAEMGLPGFALLLSLYLLCIARLWPLTRDREPVADPWLRHLARMVIASLTGFMVSAQFVSVEGIELPYFIAMIGAGVLKLHSLPVETAPGGSPEIGGPP